MDERAFWCSMNPARLHALLDSYFAVQKHVKTAPEQPLSLSEYLRGGYE